MNKRFLQWRDIDDAIERLAINITNSGTEFAAIGGLPRGGLIPAVMLSHALRKESKMLLRLKELL